MNPWSTRYLSLDVGFHWCEYPQPVGFNTSFFPIMHWSEAWCFHAHLFFLCSPWLLASTPISLYYLWVLGLLTPLDSWVSFGLDALLSESMWVCPTFASRLEMDNLFFWNPLMHLYLWILWGNPWYLRQHWELPLNNWRLKIIKTVLARWLN